MKKEVKDCGGIKVPKLLPPDKTDKAKTEKKKADKKKK